MYANYTPSSPLQLGDYGDVTKEGEFIRSGNIFQEFPELGSRLGQGREEYGSNKHFFVSRTRKKDAATVISADIPSLADCQLKLGWDIKKDRHAVLVMINANQWEIENEGVLHRFIQNQQDLADKAIVTKVYKCSAYAQLITEYRQTGSFYVGFKPNTTTSVKSTPQSSVNSFMSSTSDTSEMVEQLWLTYPQSASWNMGPYDPSQRLYSPLATLRQITPKEPSLGYRDKAPPPITDNQEMEDFIPPWAELDERGEEIEDDDD